MEAVDELTSTLTRLRTPRETHGLADNMRRTRFVLTRATIAVLLLMPAPASAQNVTEPALKAAFIYNFAKFTEWPTEVVPGGGPLVMCTLGESAVGEALERAVKGRLVGDRSVIVWHVTPVDPQRRCHLLYVSNMTAGQAAQAIAAFRDVPVLTISDIDGFTELGGIAHLYFEHGLLRFNVDRGCAKRARLQISSRLLVLARPK